MRVLSEDYVDIARLFLPVEEPTQLLLPQHRQTYTLVEDINCNGVTDNPEKLSFSIISLPDFMDDA